MSPPGRVRRGLERRLARLTGRVPAELTAGDLPARPAPPRGDIRLLVGPSNFAGQGNAWARAAERLPRVGAQSLAVEQVGGYDFPADYRITPAVYRSPVWAAQQEQYVPQHFTHVLIEGARPVLGMTRGNDAGPEIALLRQAGLSIALVAHGSDVRLPSRHVTRYPYSPFKDPTWDDVARLEVAAARFGGVMNNHDGPVFVSTPDLLDDVPAAAWLPAVLEVSRFQGYDPPLQRDRPVVVHAPSKTRFKGTELIEPTLHRLCAQGLIEYRRITGVPNDQIPGIFGQADIVLDQFVLGIYSVAANEAMAAGRVVVAHVADHVREHVREVSGHTVPIVQATIESLGEVIERLCAERDQARTQAAAGQAFVREVHDGRLSAQVLAPWLGAR